MKFFVPSLLCAIFVASCASSSDYRAASSSKSQGHSEQVLEANRYRVEYRLDDDDIGKAQDLALLRAADLTIEKGFATFEVVSRSSDIIEEERPRASVSASRDYVVTRNCGLLGCSSSTTPVYTSGTLGTFRDKQQTIVAIEIVMSNAASAATSSTYNASEVAMNIRARLDE